MIKRLFYTITTIMVLLLTLTPVFAGNATYINDVVIDEAGRIIMVKTSKDQILPKPSVSKLVAPNRLVIDIPNSVFNSKLKVIDVDNNGINQVRVAQFQSNKKLNTVRLVVETEPSKSIENIKISASPGSSMIQLENIPTGTSGSFLDSNNQITINKIDYRDNQLIIGAAGPIKIKEPFILKDPQRLVIDVPNSKISDKTLLSPIIVNDGEVDVVRIGQFNESTVRFVIETENPNRLYPIYGADQQTLYLTSNPGFSIANLPKGVSPGNIKNIKITEDRGLGTIIKIESSTALAHRTKRIHSPEKLVIDLINASPPSQELTQNLGQTAELLDIKVGRLMAGNPNSRIVLDLASPAIDVKTNLSIDGKTMEIVLKQSSKLVTLPNDGSIKVIIDAGHGGYDSGCQASGYKEKDIVLDISKRVKLLLERAGITVYMTRADDSTISLKERVEITNNINPSAFVSIHVNASRSSAPEGIDTHWYTNQSIPLARSIQNSLMKKINTVDRGIKKNMFYVIHHTPVPAVLVETGFLSNPKERREILTHKRKQLTAQAIAEGVIKFLGTKYSITDNKMQR